MYMLVEVAGAALPASTGYLIFAVSLLVLAGVLKYFTSTNEM
jgi:hypothetical protein